MRKLWLALLFFAGGLAHELRNPTGCHTICASQAHGPRRRKDSSC